MSHRIARVEINWLTHEAGGRKHPPPGPVYAPTAHFGNLDESFSVVLRFVTRSKNVPMTLEADLNLLAPDRLPDLDAKLVIGSCLFITEGARTVANAKVLSMREEPGSPVAPFGSAAEA